MRERVFSSEFALRPFRDDSRLIRPNPSGRCAVLFNLNPKVFVPAMATRSVRRIVANCLDLPDAAENLHKRSYSSLRDCVTSFVFVSPPLGETTYTFLYL